MGSIQSEHDKCSFLSVIELFHHASCHRFLCFAGSVHTVLDYVCRVYVCYMPSACYIYHDFAYVVSLYRRVFDFTVSNVSNVSILYFSRGC